MAEESETQRALEAVLREQAAIKARVAALDSRIAELRASPEKDTAAPAPEAPEAVAPEPAPLPPRKAPAVPPPLPAAAAAAAPNPAPLPAKTLAPDTDTGGGLEWKLGTYWLVRVGVVMLLTGFVFLANYYLFGDRLAPGVKVALLYLFSFGLLGAGAWLEKTRVALRNYGQVLAAGGLAAVYFTTYGAHHIESLRVIGSPLLAGFLLLLWAGCMVVLADRKQSQTLAVMGVLLAYYTSLINTATLFSLCSSLILAFAALAFLIRNRWMVVGFVSLAGTYLSFAYWRYPHLLEWLQKAPLEAGAFWPAYLFLVCYWAIFTAAVFLSSPENLSLERRSAFAGINNASFLILFGLGMLRYYPDQVWLFALVSGVVSMGLSLPAARRFEAGSRSPGSNSLADMYLVVGIALTTLSFLIKLSGVSLALTLAAESAILAVLARRRPETVILEASAWTAAGLAVFYTFLCEIHGPGTLSPAPLAVAYPADVPFFAAVGQALFLFAAAIFSRRDTAAPRFDLHACFFVAAGILCAIAGALWDLPREWRPFGFMIAGLLSAGTAYLPLTGISGERRPREIPVLGQIFTFLGLAFLLPALDRAHAFPLGASLPVLGGGLLLIAWCARSRDLAAPPLLARVLEAVLTFVFSLAIIFFVEDRLTSPADAWLYLGGLLALVQLFTGLALRARFLAVFSQLYHLPAFTTFWSHSQGAFLGALPIVLLLVNLGILHRVITIREPGPRSRGPVHIGLFSLAVLALWMFTGWVGAYFTREWHALWFAGAALALFLPGVAWNRRQCLLFALVLLGFGVADLAEALFYPGRHHWQHYLTALTPLAMQQAMRRLGAASAADSLEPAPGPLTFLSAASFRRTLHPGLIVLGVVLLWRVLSLDAADWVRGFYLTVTWSVFGLLLFALGWLLREKLYRLASLGVLAAALLRVLTVDVWTLDQVARIWSFLVIGVVLLLLGFVYTRFQERLRRFF